MNALSLLVFILLALNVIAWVGWFREFQSRRHWEQLAKYLEYDLERALRLAKTGDIRQFRRRYSRQREESKVEQVVSVLALLVLIALVLLVRW